MYSEVLPTPGQPIATTYPLTLTDLLHTGAIAGIVIGVIVGVLLILAVAIVIAIIVYKQRTSKLPKISRHDDEKLSVDFEKQWLIDDSTTVKKSGSIKKGSKVSSRTFKSCHPVLVVCCL